MTPTLEQQRIIEADNNLVVVARPGSGKTFVLSQKVRRILPLLKDYEGIIAISFTNKASDEIKDRSLKGGIDRKGSFFGTIHKFYLSEIILSFGKQLFGLPNNNLQIVDYKNLTLSEDEIDRLKYLQNLFDYSNDNQINFLKSTFLEGKIYLNLVEKYATYIYDNSLACQKYLKSKYKYIIIDEFQDCGEEQYGIFVKLKNLGLIAIAVGDLDQSIYGFTGKSSEYLSTLIKDDTFSTFTLNRNHRCHASIINYSLSLMSTNVELLETDDKRVYHRHITGDEAAIAQWIDTSIDQMMVSFQVDKLSDIAILVKGHRTEEIIDQTLAHPHRVLKQSILESDQHHISQLYDNILKFSYDDTLTITEVIENFVSLETLTRKEQIQLKQSFATIKSECASISQNIEYIRVHCEQICGILMPNQDVSLYSDILLKALNEELDLYSNRLENEIQIMTLHKSKGLEFDIVFHLDLYEWILPAKTIVHNEQHYVSFQQDLNLHYVGVTRSKKACVLCTSTQRINAQNQIKPGKHSEFLSRNNVNSLRN